MTIQKTNTSISKKLNFLHKVNEMPPLNEDIFLMNCLIMDFYEYTFDNPHYYEEIDMKSLDKLSEGDYLELKVEAKENYDNALILIHDNTPIGYIFKSYGDVFANMIKAGLELYGKIEFIGVDEYGLEQVYCDIFIKDN